MTYADLYQILIEAEARVADALNSSDVRTRSQETVDLCNQRMAREGITREQLKRLATE